MRVNNTIKLLLCIYYKTLMQNSSVINHHKNILIFTTYTVQEKNQAK